MREALRAWMRACLVAVAFTVTILLLRLALSDWLDQRIPLFLLLIVAVFAAALYDGLRSGLLTTTLGGVLGTTLFAGPEVPNNPLAYQHLRLVMFLVEGLAISGSFEAMHHARHRLEKKKSQLEKEVRERHRVEEELVTAMRRKNEFLATLAHELRNPLAPIRNCLELLRRAEGDHRATEKARSIMERQVNQMVRLVDDLLDVSRIDRNKLELRKERVSLGEIVQGAVETSHPLIEAKGHHLSLTLPSQPMMLHADPVRLTQALSNVLNNAAKYTESGGTIGLTVESNEAEVVVKVRDTGIGIPAEMLPRIFEMFTQVDQSLERSQGGLGIGLTLVKWLVEMHGGTVEAHSDGPGQGSEFMVRLPLGTVPPTQERREPESSLPGMSSGQRRRVLVVDDNEDAVTTLGTMLTVMGNEVRTAHDVLEGVEAAVAFQPDVVFLDIGMPKLNGNDACRRIREQPWGRNVVLVAHTGWGQDEDRERSTEAGFDYHLVKPVAASALQKLFSRLTFTRR